MNEILYTCILYVWLHDLHFWSQKSNHTQNLVCSICDVGMSYNDSQIIKISTVDIAITGDTKITEIIIFPIRTWK